MLKLECPLVSYQHSTPLVEYENESQGDIHYWRVFWGEGALEDYERTIGRFNSEYGLISLTHLSSIVQFTPED